ncbi:hypothetical protein K491DRAFT_316510 [Lophiostoma macrostomum CBS 122681]|uniref:Integral membrane protein n=1 Tax=Lophiostoma macrostomum CBS 122681 TaxID=1314788 RepID=A0A6A6TFT6_9PLEO|nr:hypothetical protein K491DRAFT_316510 [Lophiostoma macrostomum CBS 122681]
MVSHETPMDVPTICFGFTLGFMVLTGSKVGKQTISVYKRTKSIWSIYLFMIWAELIVCLAWAISAWLFLRGDIPGSFGFFFYIATLWTVQTQCLIQIIANRVALVMTNKQQSRLLKLSLVVAVGLINISVYVVWIPARLGISPTWVKLNEIWDRIEKVLYLLIDLGLNCYFLYLVRSKLISRGLGKYTPLFRFNAGIVVISIAMDALIIGMMSLPNDLVYTQFHSLAYIVKLNIELNMADLISKVVRRQDRTDKPNSSSNPSKGTELTSRTRTNNGTLSTHPGTLFQLSTQAKGTELKDPNTSQKAHGNIDDAASDSSSDSGINFRVPETGIVKTVAVETVVEGARSEDERDRVERGSTTSSTAQLNDYGYVQQHDGYRV